MREELAADGAKGGRTPALRRYNGIGDTWVQWSRTSEPSMMQSIKKWIFLRWGVLSAMACWLA